jgi:large subunit ribosomal protein L17
MRHGKKFNHLGRTPSHRKAMLANMASSLIKHKRVSTTVAKAKALRVYVEPIINRSKDDTTHSRRVVFSHLQDKDTVKELFSVVAGKVATRPGGYTRIIKVGNRLGDNADMCIIELVDFNEHMLKDASAAESKPKRSRRGGKKKDETEKVEAKTTESKTEKSEPKKEATKPVEAKATPAPESPKVEDAPEAKAEADVEKPKDESDDSASEGEESKDK